MPHTYAAQEASALQSIWGALCKRRMARQGPSWLIDLPDAPDGGVGPRAHNHPARTA